MPIPKTRDIGKIMDFIKKEHPEWPLAKRRAVALDTARRAGAKIPKKPKKTFLNWVQENVLISKSKENV